MMRRIHTFCILTALLLLLPCSARAADLNAEWQTAAEYLRDVGVMVGDANGDMMLDQGLTRAQLAALLTRITANPEHISADSAFYQRQCKFTDVPDWAKVYVGYCVANYLVAGYGNGLYGSNDPVTPAAACTVMLRCLGDIGTEWSYATAVQTAAALGLAPSEALTETEITRGNMAILISHTMARMGYDADLPGTGLDAGNGVTAISRNSDGSINIPSDGSRYVPCAGDIIRCDDGSNYTVADVSRYDKNAFAGGPAGELPEPSCDWIQFPQLELPAAEVRHFKLQSGDYLFVRNLYETRRMLYTIYNAIGDNAEVWQNGKPALFPSGTPKVQIRLTIPDDVEAESFWPWRESEIVGPFNSNPYGTHCLEAWDVYKNGVFQRTEYMVYHVS